jgi:hypothetical protein
MDGDTERADLDARLTRRFATQEQAQAAAAREMEQPRMTSPPEPVRDDRAAWRLVGGIVKAAVQDARRNPDAARWLDDLCSSTGGDWRQAAPPANRRGGRVADR